MVLGKGSWGVREKILDSPGRRLRRIWDAMGGSWEAPGTHFRCSWELQGSSVKIMGLLGSSWATLFRVHVASVWDDL